MKSAVLVKNYPDILERLANEQDGEDESIHLDRETMKAIFTPTLDGLVKKVEEQFKRLGNRGCDIIFLVGGFSTSPLLRQQIQQKFGTQVKKIVMPPYPGAAIVEGAVSFGLNPSVIRARRSRMTYGVRTSREFKPGDKQDKKFRSQSTGKLLCRDVFDIFVIAGESIGNNEPFTSTYTPVGNDQTQVNIEFHATKNKQVTYTDEDSVEPLGKLTVEMPDTRGGVNRKVEVIMYFGKTEIKVEAKDCTSGKQYNTTLRFSSTYSPELL